MPQVGQLRSAGLAKEVSVGALQTPPTEFIPFIPPDSFFPAITLLESTAIRAIPDRIYKAIQGPGEIKGLKLNWEAEPENIGNLLMGLFGTDVKTGSVGAGFTHTFARLVAAQLPSYSWWFDKGSSKYMQFLGCMVDKLDITCKAKEFVKVDSEWVGMKYDDTGSTQTPSYSGVKPFKFSQMVVNVDASPVNNYDNLKISFRNLIKADHVLSGSIYPGKVYSEGFEVDVSMDFVVEDFVQYAKFLAGSNCALNFALTHADDITGAGGGTKYTLTIDIPTAIYSVASYPTPSGLIKTMFTAKGIYTTGSTKTVSAALKNSVSAAY